MSKHKADRPDKSGSPSAWKLRRKAYKFGPCSNPGQPSPCNRAARRLAKALDAEMRRIAKLMTPEAPTDA